MGAVDPNRRSTYLDQLPALFQEDARPDAPTFLGRLLLAFEHVLTGLGDVDDPGLEEVLDGTTDPSSGRTLAGVERHFDPGVRAGGAVLPREQRAPAEFLEWLAGWAAVELRDHMSEAQRREMIARAATLYRKRGTREGLEQLIAVQTGLRAQITDASTPRPAGGPDVAGRGPHFFHVHVTLPGGAIETIRRQREIVEAILDAEKPAHTWYELEVSTPELQVDVHSQIGVDTLIGKPRYAGGT
jgi:phage tail-like protein